MPMVMVRTKPNKHSPFNSKDFKVIITKMEFFYEIFNTETSLGKMNVLKRDTANSMLFVFFWK